MIDQGFLKSHFLGRDGFVWWIGQVAPEETWLKNFGTGELEDAASEEAGFGERYRVRIMGYHTANKQDIPDDELPFATVMYPVTGGAGGDAAQTSNIRQGNFVYGFFLDGEEAQQPVIMGLIGHNDYQSVMEAVPSIGFKPFYGLNKKKPAGGETHKSQTESVTTLTVSNTHGGQGTQTAAESTSTSATDARSYRVVSVNAHKNRKTKVTHKQATDPSERIQKPIASADANEMPIKGMQKALQRAIQQIEILKRSIREIGDEQIERLEAVEAEINAKIQEASTFIAGAVKYLYQMIEENIFKKMDGAFKKVLALTRPSETEVTKTTIDKILETLACFFRKLFAGLLGMVSDFIKQAVDKIVNVPTCFVEKFAGNVLGTVSGFLGSAMDSIQGMVEGVVDLAGQGLDLAGDVMNMVGNLLSFLKCDDIPENSPVSEWSHIYGSGSQFGKGDIANVLNKAKEYAGAVQQGGLDALDNFNFADNVDFSNILDVGSQLDGCLTDEFPCGPPNLNIFGSKMGSGAAGNLVINAAGSVIGVDMQSFGVGYDDQARANVIDDCGNGKGAVVRPVFGDVNNNFPNDQRVRVNNNSVNPGTPATSPDSLGFGPFDPSPYPFKENTDDSIRREPYSPDTKAFGTPSYGLGPSFSKIGKRSPKQQLKIREEDSVVNFTIETFTIPVAKTKERPVIKFVLQDKSTLRNVDTDFDFSPEDQSGQGRLEDGQVVVGTGKSQFTIAPKKTILKDGLELEFKEAFDGGQRQRVVEDKTYIVRGFQFDGEPLFNPLKISNDGKCVQLDDVFGRKIIRKEKTRTIRNQPTEAKITWALGNDREKINYERNPSTYFKDKIQDNNKTIKLLDGHGDDTNAKFKIVNGDARFSDDGLSIIGKGLIECELEWNDNPGTADIAIDYIEIAGEGVTHNGDDAVRNRWTQTDDDEPRDVRTDPDDDNAVISKGKDIETFTLDEQTRIETYWVEKLDKGESDEDYNDLVICAKRGRFKQPKSARLKKEGAVLYILSEKDTTLTAEDPVIPTPIPPPITPALVPTGFTFPSPGPTGGGIPGILTPGPGKNSTFHPFPGTTTLGPGKWVPGPVPPGGGGPHVGPAVFIHDNLLLGELVSQQGTPFPGTGPEGSLAPFTGGGGGGPGSIPPGGFTPYDPGGFNPPGPGSIPPSWNPGGIGGPGDPGSIGPGPGPGDPGGFGPPLGPPSDDPTAPPGTIGPGDPSDPGGIGPGPGGGGGPGVIPPGGITITNLPPGPGTYYPDPHPPHGPLPNTPNAPGTMVPPDLGGIDGPGIGIVDIIIEDGGSGYLPTEDGSTGGDGRTYSTPEETRITYSDGVKEIPAGPGTRICLDEGDSVILPAGTTVTTEPFDGEGGGEIIKGGVPHIMQRPGCLTTPPAGERPPSQNTYPVLMYLCDVIVKRPGFGYKNTDRVIIDPSMGAEAELVVDKFGRISDVIITKPGEGFQVIPEITVESATGQNTVLLAKLCIDRVKDVSLVDQEKIIQVVDCVGKF
jgi:hypothetical protein